MDITQLAPAVTAFLAPFLPYLMGKAKHAAPKVAVERFGEGACEQAVALWEKLHPKVEARPAVRDAVQDVARDPDNEDARTALHLQLQRLLSQDPTLAKEVAQLWEEAQQGGHYTVRVDDEGTTIVQFGDGTSGERLPSGRDYVRANYRSGLVHPALDQPEVLRVLFHPRPEYHFASQALGIHPISIEVEPGISVGGRLYPASPEAPAILCYHGNGEIAADYDDIAHLYTRLGITLLVVDYRGYGMSGGTPTASNLVADAIPVFNALDGIFADQGLAPSRLYVMGRSLGSVPAIEVAVHAGKQLAGLIIESGGWDTVGLMARLGVRLQGGDEVRDGFGSRAKMSQVTIPTLVIHGQNDVLIPATDGQELFRSCAAEDKQLVLVPDAGHNDLMMVGMAQYFGAIQTFVWGETQQRKDL